MPGHTFFGKRQICYTDVTDFTDYQGIGLDPLYKRYESVMSIVKRVVPADYQHFLATPEYDENEDQIAWHINDWIETPQRLTELSGEKRAKYELIKAQTVKAYRESAMNLEGEDLQIYANAIKYINDDCIFCADGKVFLVAWGMTPDLMKHKVTGSVIHVEDVVARHTLTFNVGEHGQLAYKLDHTKLKEAGAVLTADDLPEIVADEGWEFTSWTPNPVGMTVNADMSFTAQYKEEELPPPIPPAAPVPPPFEEEEEQPKFFTCTFDAGDHGMLAGNPQIQKAMGTALSGEEIPLITPQRGWKFIGWDIAPIGLIVNGNQLFTAMYEQDLPWYKRLWSEIAAFFASHKFLKWLLWALLALLILFLVCFFLRSCFFEREINGVVPLKTVTMPDGSVNDDNGVIKNIGGKHGKLPKDDFVAAPAHNKDGSLVPIVKRPGVPNAIGNRLLLFLTDEKDNVDDLAKDFKKAYPGEDYWIIGYDRNVKFLVVQMPEKERDDMRKAINAKMPNHKFLAFDEEIYETRGTTSQASAPAGEAPGWHLNAIHAQQGWQITKGSPDVKIAIVDDGIDPAHPMFKDRITDAFNVYRKDNHLSQGEGHGTHTAGLAAGSADFLGSQGVAGVAPECKIMPVQVFDNKECPLSALVEGVMYAIHQKADVINVSIGPSYQGLNALPVETQALIAATQFQNVQQLWQRVCNLADNQKSIVVFAAGNDDIITSVPPANRIVQALAVTAVDHNLYPTDFTDYGPCSDISAPGRNITSAYPGGTYKSMDGTSMAAPIVSGAVALMKSVKKDLTVVQARNVLFRTGADVYGWVPPMVLLDRALQGVMSGNFNTPPAREIKGVPGGVNAGSAGSIYHLGGGSGIIDEMGVSDDDDQSNYYGIVRVVNGRPVIAGYGDVAVGDGTGTVVDPSYEGDNDDSDYYDDGSDYDYILRQIAEYERRIKELKKQLPNN